MLSIETVCLIAAIVTPAQDAPEMPEAWRQKVEAAAKAEEAEHPIKAEALLAEIVEEAEKFGKDDLRVAKPLEQLAYFYMNNKRKRCAEAEPLLRRALAIREKAQGTNHPDVASTLLDLAMCRIVADEKQADTAGPMLRRAMAIVEESRGQDAPELARVLNVFAVWRMKRKELDAAEAALTRAVAIREKALRAGDPQVADLLDSLGAIHAAQCDGINREADQVAVGDKPKTESQFERHRRQAESFYTRALAIREKALKPDHPRIAQSLFNLGQLATMRGRDAEAERYLDRWQILEEKAKAPASERQAKVLMMLATASMARKDFDQAERRLAKAQAAIDTVKGADSNEASMILSARADNAQLAGRLDDAERFLKRGLEIQAALIGPDDADVKQARALMVSRYRDHVDDRRAPVLWHRLDVLGDEARWKRQHGELDDILQGYASLLRRTNRVLPRPTEEDLAYLKKVGAMIPEADLNFLTKTQSLPDGGLDNEGLAHIARLYDIDHLYLHNRSITDAGLAHLKDLVNLRSLDLSGLPITDAGLAHVKGLTDLQDLNLMRTRITDAGLVHLGVMENLEKLHIGFTRVDDAGLAHLGKLKRLRDLDLTYTNVTDAGIENLKGLGQLKKIDLKYTKVTATGINRLRQARPDIEIKSESRPAGFPEDPGDPALVPALPAIPPEGPALAPLPPIPAEWPAPR